MIKNNKKFSIKISCLVLIVAICIEYFFIHRADVIVIDNGFDRFPLHFDGYSGEDINMDVGIVNELDTDAYVYRNYYKNGIITLYIGYYGTKKGGRTGHNPNVCYPSSGYAINSENKINLPVDFMYKNNSNIMVTRLLVSKNKNRQIVYHWYQSSANTILSNGIEQNIHRFKNKILYNRNDGAFVRVSTMVSDDISSAESDLMEFTKKIIPLIETFWPIER